MDLIMRRNCIPKTFLKERLKFLVVDGTIIRNNIKSLTLCEGVNWIHASHIRTYVNRFLGPNIYKREVFLHYMWVLFSKKGLVSMKLKKILWYIQG
jgi:hypothetical protein